MKALAPYYMLSDKELWDRIRRLERKVVKTIVIGKKNLIIKVLPDKIIMKGMKPIYRSKILEAYHKLLEAGFVYNHDFHSTVIAILLEALPEQIEKRLIDGHPALKIKTFKWVEKLSGIERQELLWDLLITSEEAIKKGNVKPIENLIESWQETVDITSDKKLMRELKKAEKEYELGDSMPWKEVKKKLNL